MKIFGIVEAINSLYPEAQWVLRGDDYEGLEWLSEDSQQPNESVLQAEAIRLQQEHDSLEYQRLRSLEYPDFKTYLDGIVKGDQEQVDQYISACLAVKAKYPKPE